MSQEIKLSHYSSDERSKSQQEISENCASVPSFGPLDLKDTRKVYSDRSQARNAGYRSSWEWRRKYRQVVKGAKADAVLFVLGDEPTPEQLECFGGWHGSLQVIHAGRLISRKVALYRADQTKPYRPTERTEALWRYGDVFVTRRERYVLRVSRDGWHRYEADYNVRLLLNDTALGNHCRGKHIVGVFAGPRTEFLVVRTKSPKHAETLVSRSEDIVNHLSAQKLFAEVSQDGFEMWIILNGPWKTQSARRRLEALLRRFGIVGEVFPQFDTPISLPLASFKTTFTDEIDLTGDVVSFAHWLEGGRRAALPDALDHFRLQLAEEKISEVVQPVVRKLVRLQQHHEHAGDGSMGMGLLSIPYQNEDSTNNGPLKNRCWQQLTSFWQGEPSDLDLDRALIITARILAFEGVPQEEAEDLLLVYAENIPNPTSSRLLEGCKRSVLLKDIRKSVKRAYEENGRQETPDASSEILRNVVKMWKAKGLELSDKATWRNVKGYLAVRPTDIEFKEGEIEALEGRLRGLLSKRDLKGLGLKEAVRQLASAVVRLVAGKEAESLAVPYWSKYLSAETGMNFGNRNKVIKARNAFIDCGFIKVLRKGSEGAGGTRYGLGPVMAERLNRPVLVSTGEIPDDWEQLVENVVRPFEDQMEEVEVMTSKDVGVLPMGLLSIPYQKHKSLINSPLHLSDAYRDEGIRRADEEADREWEEMLRREGFA